jgi:hypothetical protein
MHSFLLSAILLCGLQPARSGGLLPCNVSGAWWWPHFLHPMTFAEPVTAHGSFTFASTNPGTPWKLAHGVLHPNRSVYIDYGCGTGVPCQTQGSIDVPCAVITFGGGAYTRQRPPMPPPQPLQPPLPLPRSFGGDVAWLTDASVWILGASQLPVVANDSSRRTIVSPNMQPGGYGGEFTRDYTYGLVHAPWRNATTVASQWNLSLDTFLWASEQLLLGVRAADGQLPDVVNVVGHGVVKPGVNRCSDQACTFPPGSPLPRPACCGGGVGHPRNCSDGSMDSAPFAVFNALWLTRTVKAERGATAAAALLARWLPALLRGLALTPSGPGASALAYNSPADPIVGYGFEDSVAKTGDLNFASLLTLEACALLCHAARGYATEDGVAEQTAATEALCVRAATISKELSPALWNEEVGMLRPSTGLESNLTDIWGSAYAATLDGTHTMLGGTDAWPADVPPPITAVQRARIVSFMANKSLGIFAAGQVRHLPVGESWVQEWCVPTGGGPGAPPCAVGWLYSPIGVYQNGGFWATPVHHVWPLLHRDPATRALACGLLRDFVSSVTNEPTGAPRVPSSPAIDLLRINEWVDAAGSPNGAKGYLASAANAAAAGRTMVAQGGCSYDEELQ